jgi:hypothetical protein
MLVVVAVEQERIENLMIIFLEYQRILLLPSAVVVLVEVPILMVLAETLLYLAQLPLLVVAVAHSPLEGKVMVQPPLTLAVLAVVLAVVQILVRLLAEFMLHQIHQQL